MAITADSYARVQYICSDFLIELLAHEHEYARLGEQIFRYQIEMFKSIRSVL